MEQEILEYAKEHLERELDMCDNPYIDAYVEDERIEVENPDHEPCIHDNPHYRSKIAYALMKVNELLERG